MVQHFVEEEFDLLDRGIADRVQNPETRDLA